MGCTCYGPGYEDWAIKNYKHLEYSTLSVVIMTISVLKSVH